MRRLAATALPLAAALLLAGCSSPSAEDETACKLFADANNRMNQAILDWQADGSPSGGSDQARSEAALLPGRVADARDRATGDLAILLRDAADYAALEHADQNEDAGVAYILTQEKVYEACADLGVSLDLVELDV